MDVAGGESGCRDASRISAVCDRLCLRTEVRGEWRKRISPTQEIYICLQHRRGKCSIMGHGRYAWQSSWYDLARQPLSEIIGWSTYEPCPGHRK